MNTYGLLPALHIGSIPNFEGIHMATRTGNFDHTGWTQEAYPQGWAAADISREKIMLRLSAEAVDDLAACLRRVQESEKAWHQVTKTDFSTPTLDFELGEARRRLRQRGLPVLLKGLCPNDFSQEEVEKIFFGLGMHMGKALPQGATGDLLSRVGELYLLAEQHGGQQPSMQTDSAETVGLLCLRRAITGGETVLSSALRVYTLLAQQRPDLLDILERGLPRLSSQGDGTVTNDSPVFSRCQGLLSCQYKRRPIEEARRWAARALTPLEIEALNYLDALAASPDLQFRFQLEPGEILWLNSFETFYARSPFQNHFDPSRGRLLYRLWLQDNPSRPLQEGILGREAASARGEVKRRKVTRCQVARDPVAML